MLRTVFISLLVVALLLPGLALAEPTVPFDDEQYVVDWFGTDLVVFSTTSIADEGWIGEILPEEFTYDTSYLIGLVNAFRLQQDYEPLLDPDTYFSFDYEYETDGGYESHLRFPGLRPSEVMLLFKSYGGTSEFFGEGQLSYMPLLTRDFYADNEDAMAPLVLDIDGVEVTIDAGSTINEIEAVISDGFEQRYDQEVMLSIYYNVSTYSDGYNYASLSVTAELPAG